MFLHEPGDENESFSRQDLSAMNVISTQSPQQASPQAASQTPQPQPPPQQAPQAIAAASHASDRRSSKDSHSQSEDAEAPALPSSANWGSRRAPSRQLSQAVSVSSPSTSNAAPISQQAPEQPPQPIKQSPSQRSPPPVKESPQQRPVRTRRPPSLLGLYQRMVSSEDFKFVFDEDVLDSDLRDLSSSLPPWFDPNGGVKRRIGQKEALEQNFRESDNQVASQALAAISANDPDEGAVAGSLQLGGEPDDQNLDMRQRHNAIQPPSIDTVSSPIFGMEQTISPTAAASNPQQRQALLQQFKSASPNPLASGNGQPSSGQTSHGRQHSRFSFANDSSASASVNPVASQKLMNQQKNMMPPSHFQQQSGSQYFPSGVQGPPPGLKTTGTPPVSGGGMFGQGHGFATAGLSYGVNASGRNNSNDEMMRELLRNRGGSAGSGHASDASRREFMFPLSSQSSTPTSYPGLSSFPYGPQSGAFQDHGPQKQKKKGKKHRHANTSSSGGGVVDLADPSILQARMHQTGAAGNQGLYNPQGQGQGGFHSIYGNSFGGRW